MFRHTDDFIREFGQEAASTLNIFRSITNEALVSKPHDKVRSLQRLAWHITLTLGEMPGKAGLKIEAPDEHSAPPDNIETICKTYETAANSLLNQVKTHWNDADLLTEVNMYGESWNKGTVLSVLIKHEAHHRGQLTVLMRLCGLSIPGVYGPSREEWAAWNMESPE